MTLLFYTTDLSLHTLTKSVEENYKKMPVFTKSSRNMWKLNTKMISLTGFNARALH